MDTKELIKHIDKYIASSGYKFREGLTENFYLCLKSKPFVILKGAHGCGKYTFVRLFCESLGITGENDRLKTIRVDGNSLCAAKISTAISEYMQKAENDGENPYFLYLDSINLINPETYLSHLLFAMDTRNLPPDGNLTFPSNLYIVGSLVLDYDAFPLSMTIKDRANIIEMPPCDMLSFIKKETPQKPVCVKNEFLMQKYIAPIDSEKDEYLKITSSVFAQINKSLRFLNREISYRTRNEILIYLILNKEYELLDEAEAFDNILIQRIIPRVDGSEAYVKTILSLFYKICVPKGIGDYSSNSLKMFRALSSPDCRYPKTAEKITYMTKNYEDKGYCSFAD